MFRRALLVLGIVGMAMTGYAEEADPVRVLILSGRNNHDWEATTPELVKLYEESGRFTADVTDDPASCDAETLAKYDVVVDNWCAYPEMTGRQWGETMENALVDFVKSGKGLVVFHAASACFTDWPEFKQMAGYMWGELSGHGHRHPYRVTVVDREHPITKGMPDYIGNKDELYHKLDAQPGAHILCSAYSDPETNGTGEHEPVAVCTTTGKGRTFYNIMGHDLEAMANVGWRTLMLRGTEWAATGETTIPIPDDWPTVEE